MSKKRSEPPICWRPTISTPMWRTPRCCYGRSGRPTWYSVHSGGHGLSPSARGGSTNGTTVPCKGRSKVAVRLEVGDEAFLEWRRSYEHAPPSLPEEAATTIRTDPRYATLPAEAIPVTEALVDVRRRVVPYWEDVLAVDLRSGKIPLVVAHGNSLRALCMHLDGLSPNEVAGLNIPTGVPLRYDLDVALHPIVRGGTYLDPIAAAAGTTEVAVQGISDPA